MIQRVLAAGLAVMLLCGSTLAESVPIKNASFETTDPPLDVGGWTNTLVDWSGPPNAADAFIEYIDMFHSEGNNHLGIQTNAEVSQDLGVPAMPNTTYILTVGVGRRNESFTVEGNQSTYGLYVGGDAEEGGTLLGEKSFDAFPLSDLTFVDDTLSVTTGDTVPAGNLVISLRSTGPQRAHFDNIRLEAIPEPSSLVLALLGILAVTARRRGR